MNKDIDDVIEMIYVNLYGENYKNGIFAPIAFNIYNVFKKNEVITKSEETGNKASFPLKLLMECKANDVNYVARFNKKTQCFECSVNRGLSREVFAFSAARGLANIYFGDVIENNWCDINDHYNSDNTKKFAGKLLVPKFLLVLYIDMLSDINSIGAALGVDPTLIVTRAYEEGLI